MLQQVLTQIGQQQPELLQEINANQAVFLEMMNEPVDETAPAAPSAPTGRSALSGNRMLGGLPGMANPMQMNEIIQNMSPEELNQMAATMGVTPEQLRVTAQLVGQMPPDQFQEHMMQAMQNMPAEQLQEYMMQAMQQDAAMEQGGGGMLGGRQILRLTEEEMAAVDRLTEMGFDRAEAAQAFLACDKNEALAANLLMDSMGDGGGAFGFEGSGDDHNHGDHHDGDDDADDEMYD
jgi:UV excision repair protein RAD23